MEETPQPSGLESPPKPFWRRHLASLLRLGITALGLLLVWRTTDLRALALILRSVDLVWMAVGLLLIGLSLVVRAYRWRLVLQGVGATVRFGRLVELYFVGSFFNAFFPSGFGGDIVRVAEVAENVDTDIAVSTVLIDRLTGLVALFAMALATLPFRPPGVPQQLVWSVLIICGGGLAIGLLVLDGRLLRRFLRYAPASVGNVGNGLPRRTIKTIDACSWRAIALALLVSVLFNLMQVAWWETAGRALGIVIPYSYYLLVVPIMSIALLVPSIGGLGVRESLAPALFAGAGIPAEQAVAITLLVFVLERMASLLGAPVYIYATFRDARARRQNGKEVADIH